MDQAGGDCTAFTNQIVCPQSQCEWNAVENTCEPQGEQVQSQGWEEKCSIARCAGCDQCDTTTTTTTAAPASKEETCEDALTFGVSTENLVENTLGGGAG